MAPIWVPMCRNQARIVLFVMRCHPNWHLPRGVLANIQARITTSSPTQRSWGQDCNYAPNPAILRLNTEQGWGSVTRWTGKRKSRAESQSRWPAEEAIEVGEERLNMCPVARISIRFLQCLVRNFFSARALYSLWSFLSILTSSYGYESVLLSVTPWFWFWLWIGWLSQSKYELCWFDWHDLWG